MSDQQQPDPWATVYALWSITTHDGRGNVTERLVYLKSEVDAARAEVERRHAEDLSILSGQKEAAERREAELQAHADALEDRHAEALKAKDADRDALLYRVGELATERDTLRAQLAAVQETAHAVLREWDDYKTTGQLRAGGAMYDLRVALEPLTLKEPTVEGGARHE